MSQTPIKAETPCEPASKNKGFRFNADQRAYLEARAAIKNHPNYSERIQQAKDLNVEEKTVRVCDIVLLVVLRLTYSELV